MITKGMVAEGFQRGLIRLIDAPYDHSAVCEIGDYWFYLSDDDSLALSVDEYVKIVPVEKTIDNIFMTLEEFRESEDDVYNSSYTYYESFLLEHEISPRKYTVSMDVTATIEVEVDASSFEEAYAIARKQIENSQLADLDGNVYNAEPISATREDGEITYW